MDVQVWAADRSYASVQLAEGQGCVTRVRPSARRTSSIVRCLDRESAEVPSVQQAEGQGCVTQVRPSACRTSSSARTMMPGSLQRFDPSLAFLSCASLSSSTTSVPPCTLLVFPEGPVCEPWLLMLCHLVEADLLLLWC